MRFVNVVISTRSPSVGACVDLGQHVVDLRAGRPYLDVGIDETRRPHDLLYRLIRMRVLVRARRRRHEDRLRRDLLVLLERQRPVVERRRQAETVLDERFLARAVAFVHAADLRNRRVALVDEQQRVVGQVVEQARRRLAGAAPREIARVVLDPVAVADLEDHLQVEARALLEPLRLDELVRTAQPLELQREIGADLVHAGEQRLARRDVVRLRVDRRARHALRDLARQRVEVADLLDLVVEQLDAHGLLLRLRGKDVDDVAAHAIRAAREVERVARVLELRQAAQEIALVQRRAAGEMQDHAVVCLWIAEAVDSRHRRHDDDVAPLEHRFRRRQPHLLDVAVDRRILFDVRVARGHVGLGLVVVVVRDEVFDGVVRKELAHLAVELRRQRLVVREDQRRPLEGVDDMGHGKSLSRPRDSEQRLLREPGRESVNELRDRLRLIAGGSEIRDEL